MASYVYDAARLALADGSIDWAADSFLVLLSDDDPGPSAVFASSITSELSGSGYSRQALVTYAPADNTGALERELAADDVTWTGVTAPAGDFRYAHILKDAGGADTANPLVACYDRGASRTPSGLAIILDFPGDVAITRPYALDSAVRADSSSTAGPLYTSLDGTFGVSTNRIYYVGGASTTPLLVHDTGSADFTLAFDLPVLPSGDGFTIACLRMVDASNGYVVNLDKTTGILKLYVRTAGSFTLLATAGSGTAAVAGDTFSVLAFGSTIDVYHNGTQRISTTDSTHAGTEHGMVGGGGCMYDTLRFDGDFAASAATPELEVTAVFSDWSPAPGDTDTSATREVSVTVTPTNVLNALDTLDVTINGEVFSFDSGSVALLAAGAWRATAEHVDDHPGRPTTVSAVVTTADTNANDVAPFTYTPRRPFAASPAFVDFAEGRSPASPVFVDFIPARFGVSPVPVEWDVLGTGPRFFSPALVDFNVIPSTAGPLNYVAVKTDYLNTEFERQVVGVVGAVVSQYEQSVLSVGAAVESTDRYLPGVVGAEITSTEVQIVSVVGAEVTTFERSSAGIVGAVVSEYEQSPLVVGCEVWASDADLLFTFCLYSLLWQAKIRTGTV